MDWGRGVGPNQGCQDSQVCWAEYEGLVQVWEAGKGIGEACLVLVLLQRCWRLLYACLLLCVRHRDIYRCCTETCCRNEHSSQIASMMCPSQVHLFHSQQLIPGSGSLPNAPALHAHPQYPTYALTLYPLPQHLFPGPSTIYPALSSNTLHRMPESYSWTCLQQPAQGTWSSLKEV